MKILSPRGWKPPIGYSNGIAPPQLVVIVEILVAQRQAVDPLGQHLLDAVLRQPR